MEDEMEAVLYVTGIIAAITIFIVIGSLVFS